MVVSQTTRDIAIEQAMRAKRIHVNAAMLRQSLGRVVLGLITCAGWRQYKKDFVIVLICCSGELLTFSTLPLS